MLKLITKHLTEQSGFHNMRPMAEDKRIDLDEIEQDQLFLDTLWIRRDIAIMDGDIRDKKELAIISKFIRCIKKQIVRDAKEERNLGGSFLARHALNRFNDICCKKEITTDVPKESIARFLADEANEEEKLEVAPLLEFEWFQELHQEMKMVFD